jgi:lysophospholipase L1-like esterase
MKPIEVFSPERVNDAQNPAPLSNYDLQFLAQGDSWFSFGAVPPWNTTNLFDGMGTSAIAACVVNCARPGAKLSVMADTTLDAQFLAYLNGHQSQQWAGLLLSGGGNDLIAALQEPPANAADLRLLATQAEWTNAPGAERYLSNAGWQTFCTHLTAVFKNLLTARDAGVNRGLPIVMHTYDITVPHDAGAGPGIGPWLYPAMQAFNIPEKDWSAVARVLLDRLQTLLDHLSATTADGSVHIIHSQGTLTPALTTDTGATADWENEIHPSRQGYQKLSALWLPVLDAVFASRINVAAA